MTRRAAPGIVLRSEIPGNAFVAHESTDGPDRQLDRFAIMAREHALMRMCCKNFGLQLARQESARILPPGSGFADDQLPGSHPCRQADFTTPWFRHWMDQLGLQPVYHRKLWEYAYIAQTLHACGMLADGRRGVGFGCGVEPLPSLFAALGCQMLATDAPETPEIRSAWAETGQYTTALESLFVPGIVDRERFLCLVETGRIDMNSIPDNMQGYDFCWSTCALEHLGTLERSIGFILASLRTIRSGGVAVHTTEYDFSPGPTTIESGPTVFFKRHSIEALVPLVAEAGGEIIGLDHGLGDMPLDRHLDLPPHAPDLRDRYDAFMAQWADAHPTPNLKASVDGLPVTCFGLAIRKR